jgi:hypothetical protein
MSSPKILGLGSVARIVFAAAALGMGAALVAMQLMPGKPLMAAWLQLGGGALALVLVLSVLTLLSLTVRQFILRKGGTDTQWFWFSAEPPGLALLHRGKRAP